MSLSDMIKYLSIFKYLQYISILQIIFHNFFQKNNFILWLDIFSLNHSFVSV